jgi:hypothetical protein
MTEHTATEKANYPYIQSLKGLPPSALQAVPCGVGAVPLTLENSACENDSE